MSVYRICFYVPESHCEIVKQAIFSAGAGRMGNYANCCWQTKGHGEYTPLENSQPHLGSHGQKHQLVEYKVETVCNDNDLSSVLLALTHAHPYEEPAYEAYKIVTLHDHS